MCCLRGSSAEGGRGLHSYPLRCRGRGGAVQSTVPSAYSRGHCARGAGPDSHVLSRDGTPDCGSDATSHPGGRVVTAAGAHPGRVVGTASTLRRESYGCDATPRLSVEHSRILSTGSPGRPWRARQSQGCYQVHSSAWLVRHSELQPLQVRLSSMVWSYNRDNGHRCLSAARLDGAIVVDYQS